VRYTGTWKRNEQPPSRDCHALSTSGEADWRRMFPCNKEPLKRIVEKVDVDFVY
jgi:hypothetical protein